MQANDRVLVVDDEEEIRDLMCRLLESADYVPMTAKNGVEGLEVAREVEPDLMMLDVKMPEKDGWKVLEEIRLDPKLSDLPVIMLTALDSSDEVVKGFNLGADDYLTKPFEYQVVKARIHAVIRRARVKRVKR
ncbi:MAG: response regulator transcription factor [Candidatus Bipolaricaulota bacterium]